MRTLIAIPCMDMVHTLFMRSLISMERVGEVRYGISCSSLIYDARNSLLRQAIESGCERIMWLDSDMDFPPDIMKRLSARLDEGLDLVSALCFKRKTPIKPVIYSEIGYWHDEEKNEVTPQATTYDDYPKNTLFEIEGCGFGCVMMTVESAKKIIEEHGVPFSPILGFGEDLSYCMRMKDCGYKMWCDSSIKVGHIGLATVTENTYLQGRTLHHDSI